MKIVVGIGMFVGGMVVYKLVEIQWSFDFIISLTIRLSKEVYVLHSVCILMSR